MTTPQFVFACSLFLLGGYFGGVTGYVLLRDKRRQSRRRRGSHR